MSGTAEAATRSLVSFIPGMIHSVAMYVKGLEGQSSDDRPRSSTDDRFALLSKTGVGETDWVGRTEARNGRSLACGWRPTRRRLARRLAGRDNGAAGAQEEAVEA